MNAQRPALVVLLLIAGCGRVDFDARTDGSNGSSADACAFGPFATPRELAEIDSTTDEYGPWLSEDRLEILFASLQSGNSLLYRAQRASPTVPFGPPVVIAGMPADSDDPFVTDDGLSLWFDSLFATGMPKVMLATRASTAVEFTNPQMVPELESSQADGGPDLTSDELAIVISSKRPGTVGDYDLYIATRARKIDPFSAPVPLAALNTVDEDAAGTLSGDGRTLMFESRGLVAGNPANRLGITQLTTPTQAAPPQLFAPEIAPASGYDTDPFLTRDGRTLVFSSSRPGGTGGYDLYLAERACL